MKPTIRLDDQRSPCPVAAMLDLLGDRWTLLIIRDLFAGKSRFKDLAASPEGVATNILTDRLHKLTQRGLIAATPLPDRAGAHDYHLTDLGRSLRPVLEAMRDWGLTHIRNTKALIRVPDRETRAATDD